MSQAPNKEDNSEENNVSPPQGPPSHFKVMNAQLGGSRHKEIVEPKAAKEEKKDNNKDNDNNNDETKEKDNEINMDNTKDDTVKQGKPQRAKRVRRSKRQKDNELDDSNSKIIHRVKREKKYEYLDHTADIQIHAWGNDMTECFENAAIAMFGYMTDLENVECYQSYSIKASGHDLESLLYNFLNECLVTFSCENYLLFKDVIISEFDRKNFIIKATGYGEEMDLSKHSQGTEIKAITYSAMEIKDDDEKKKELLVVVDI